MVHLSINEPNLNVFTRDLGEAFGSLGPTSANSIVIYDEDHGTRVGQGQFTGQFSLPSADYLSWSGTVNGFTYTDLESHVQTVTITEANYDLRSLVTHLIPDSPAGQFGFLLSGNDVIIASNGDDVMAGFAGNDTIRGNAGNDIVIGGSGTVDPTDGSDALYGDLGNDTIYGNGGNDTIFGGRDVVDSEDGSDVIYGGGGSDVIYANSGNDRIFGGGSASDPADGGDLIYGGKGSDTIFGNGGDDTIYGGGSGVDPADQGDSIHGGAGNDIIYGNGGNDTINGGTGDDTLYGGAGQDRFVFDSAQSGHDVIAQWDGDIVQIAGAVYHFGTVADVMAHISYASNNAVIDLGSGNDVTILGVAPGAITADHIALI